MRSAGTSFSCAGGNEVVEQPAIDATTSTPNIRDVFIVVGSGWSRIHVAE
jgi:hypothetical protein